MERLLKDCATIFDRSPQPFGVVRVTLKDDGTPEDVFYEYLNPSMAAITGQKPEDLLHQGIYRIWPDGDLTWLNYFYLAAYHGKSCEFESFSLAIQQLQSTIIFPIKSGYCGFFTQDVTKWVNSIQMSMDQESSSLLFCDVSNAMVYVLPALREMFQLDFIPDYTEMETLANSLFIEEDAKAFLRRFASLPGNSASLSFEGRREDGSWLQISMSHTGCSDKFAYGFLRDITRMKQAELRSARRMDIIDSLSHENFALYIADLDANTIELYRMQGDIDNPLSVGDTDGRSYQEFVDTYIESYVAEDDRERVKGAIRNSALIEWMENGSGDFSINYKRSFNGEEQFVELRIIRLQEAAHKAVLAARNINDEIREQLTQKAALQDALDLAKHASQAKSTFLTNMSHDFRTPMNSITGFAGIALDNLEDTERVKDCLNKIIVSSEHLLDLINDVLDVSRVESGKLSLTLDEVDLDMLLKDIYVVFSGQAAEKNIHFTIDCTQLANKVVTVDKLRLNQILMNTIGNAFKFTPVGGKISVSVKEVPSNLKDYGLFVFRIEDNGCGMSKDFLGKIFTPFERDGKNAMSHAEGTGLGMAITKNLVTLFGGSIEVQSQLGEGSRFTIRLPLKLMDPDAAKTVRSAVSKSAETRRFDGKRALVVDDDELSREVMVEILKKYGFSVEEAMDGYEAVQMVSESEPGHYDVVIMDMRMPNMNGDEACKLIRAMDRPDSKTLPIIAATADAFEEGHRLAKESGMTAHTTKPINIKELLGILGKYV